MYPESTLPPQSNSRLYSAIFDGNYAAFNIYYDKQQKNPNVTNPWHAANAIHSSDKNLNICAQLLKDGASLNPIAGLDRSGCLTHRALSDNNWPLVCLIIYMRGMEPFERLIDSSGKTGIDLWKYYRQYDRTFRPLEDGYAWLRTVQYQLNLAATGKFYLAKNQYQEAFNCYNQAACMLLTFDQGDKNLQFFFQEEAVPLFFQAAQCLVAQMSAAPPAYNPHQPQSLAPDEWKILQQLKLCDYLQFTVLVNIDRKIEGVSKFTDLLKIYNIPKDPHTNRPNIPNIDWTKPELAAYLTTGPLIYTPRSRSDSGVKSASSNENLHSTSSA